MTEPRRPTIGVLTGYWSTNIGNSFFQLGAAHLLRQVCPNANVFMIGDQPGYWNVSRGNPKHALDYVKHLEIDALAILGPFFRPEMWGIVGDALQAMRKKGTKLIVLAAGMMTYDDDTVAESRKLLERAHPWIFTTRDRETFDRFGDLADHAYDGVDVATFVSEIHEAVPTDLPPYVVLNFDQIPEPRFRKAEGGFDWRGATWIADQPRWRTSMSYRSRAFPYADALAPRAPGPTELDGLDVLRTDHRYNPFLMKKSYASPQTYVGDVPYTYLNMYANTECTFSNRVHACVATAAYGKPAMLFTRSPRAYLLNRLGMTTVKERPTTLDPDFLRDEKAKLIAWVGDRMADLPIRS